MSKPAYVAVADTLAARYAALAPGTLVGSEHQIADEFGINRLTAREALRELERRLLVRREMGRGTFTAFRLEYVVEPGAVASFHRNVEAAGHKVTNMSTELRRAGGQLVVRRVAAVDGFTALAGDDRFPGPVGTKVADRVADGSSIHLALEAAGYVPRRQSVHVSVEVPPPDIGPLLGFAGSPPPTWRLRSVTIDVGTGKVIDRSDGWMRTDMFDVHVRLGSSAV